MLGLVALAAVRNVNGEMEGGAALLDGHKLRGPGFVGHDFGNYEIKRPPCAEHCGVQLVKVGADMPPAGVKYNIEPVAPYLFRKEEHLSGQFFPL